MSSIRFFLQSSMNWFIFRIYLLASTIRRFYVMMYELASTFRWIIRWAFVACDWDVQSNFDNILGVLFFAPFLGVCLLFVPMGTWNWNLTHSYLNILLLEIGLKDNFIFFLLERKQNSTSSIPWVLSTLLMDGTPVSSFGGLCSLKRTY